MEKQTSKQTNIEKKSHKLIFVCTSKCIFLIFLLLLLSKYISISANITSVRFFFFPEELNFLCNSIQTHEMSYILKKKKNLKKENILTP